MSESIDPELHELEQALGQLRPAAVDFGRDRVLFEAGQVQAASQLRRWRWACGVLAAVCVFAIVYGTVAHFKEPRIQQVLIAQPILPRAPIVEEEPEAPATPQPEVAPPDLSQAPSSSWRMQQQILRTGELPRSVEVTGPELDDPMPRSMPDAWSLHRSPTFMHTLRD
jgi:hypothetical protein